MSRVTARDSRRPNSAAARRRSIFLNSLRSILLSSYSRPLQLRSIVSIVVLATLLVLVLLKGSRWQLTPPNQAPSSATIIQTGGVHVGDNVIGEQIHYDVTLEHGRK